MRTFKKLVVVMAVLVLSAVGAANASAAEFTSTAEGVLHGEAEETQVFTINNGTIECEAIEFTGGKTDLAGTSQHATVEYTECVAFVVADVHISPATYLFTANGEVHIEDPITIEVTVPLGLDCHVTVGPQTVATVDYSSASGKLTLDPTISGIEYTTTGNMFWCGTGGTNGTYTGASIVELTGGELAFDA